ncbi:hypothetical protein [Saccharospirillum impatiens]|uniref:hypothetical protein n=1 Tax=Saccharospirillum impatiens TaxID=169438 RepID=UPI0012FB1153|nr:hypothetical protein [Saccharospirillum impatiens]
MFEQVRAKPVPRPSAWRLVTLQAVVALIIGLVVVVMAPGVWLEVVMAGALCVLAQSYFTWRSLRHFGSRYTALFVVATSQGLFGKWIILAAGLIPVWVTQPDLSAITMLLVVVVLNTLSAMLAPILVK